MRVETDEAEIIERVPALDVGKAEVVCCVRVPGPGGRRMQEVRTTSTMTSALLALGDWLASLGVTRVVMEATSDYWRAPFYLLEDWFETWLVNAHDVKHLPGRPKTDRLDAVWLCKVAERQMLRPSFVPPPRIRQLRDLTRYRVDLLAVRTAEKQRVEKLLEDALISSRSWSATRSASPGGQSWPLSSPASATPRCSPISPVGRCAPRPPA
jgi:transposase